MQWVLDGIQQRKGQLALTSLADHGVYTKGGELTREWDMRVVQYGHIFKLTLRTYKPED